MKHKRALLIGGDFHLTEMQINRPYSNNRDRITMMKPIRGFPELPIKQESEPVMCEMLIYKIVGEIPSGLLIYELDSEASQ